MRAFTLVELIIILAIIAVILGAGGFFFRSCGRSQNKQYAEKQGMEFMKTFVNNDAIRWTISCQETDSNDNGYVSCTGFIYRRPDYTEPLELECASKWSLSTGEGCRFARPNFGATRKFR